MCNSKNSYDEEATKGARPSGRALVSRRRWEESWRLWVLCAQHHLRCLLDTTQGVTRQWWCQHRHYSWHKHCCVWCNTVHKAPHVMLSTRYPLVGPLPTADLAFKAMVGSRDTLIKSGVVERGSEVYTSRLCGNSAARSHKSSQAGHGENYAQRNVRQHAPRL